MFGKFCRNGSKIVTFDLTDIQAKRVRFKSPQTHEQQQSDRYYMNSADATFQNGTIKMEISNYVSIVIYMLTTASFTTSVFGFLATQEYRITVSAGVLVAVFAIAAAVLVTFSGRVLTHTAVLQGYLVMGMISAISLSAQIGIVVLLGEISKQPFWGELVTWVEFLGGAQWVMASMAAIIVIFSCILTHCGNKTPRRATVDVLNT